MKVVRKSPVLGFGDPGSNSSARENPMGHNKYDISWVVIAAREIPTPRRGSQLEGRLTLSHSTSTVDILGVLGRATDRRKYCRKDA